MHHLIRFHSRDRRIWKALLFLLKNIAHIFGIKVNSCSLQTVLEKHIIVKKIKIIHNSTTPKTITLMYLLPFFFFLY